MATVIDAQQELIDLIVANWNDANTDSVTPTIDKITNNAFNIQFGDDKGYVLVYSLLELENPAGIGNNTNADVNETIVIDIRYGGQGHLPVADIESRFNKYKAELKSILYSNVVNPSTNFCILNLDAKNIQNLSNRSKKLFRETRQVTMIAYNRDLTA